MPCETCFAQKKDFAHVAGELLSKWFDPGLTGSLVDGLRKAGLEIPDDPAKPGASPAITGSGAARADEGFWVAVLPFKYSGRTQNSKALADGLSEEIVTGLSRFSYLRVIARSSTSQDCPANRATSGQSARTWVRAM